MRPYYSLIVQVFEFEYLGVRKVFVVLAGEYEGYQAYAAEVRIESIIVDPKVEDPVRHLQGLALVEQLGFETLFSKYKGVREGLLKNFQESCR